MEIPLSKVTHIKRLDKSNINEKRYTTSLNNKLKKSDYWLQHQNLETFFRKLSIDF